MISEQNVDVLYSGSKGLAPRNKNLLPFPELWERFRILMGLYTFCAQNGTQCQKKPDLHIGAFTMI